MSELDKFKDELAVAAYGRSRTESLASKICVKCGADNLSLRNQIEEKEYTMSAMCGVCQREFFDNET